MRARIARFGLLCVPVAAGASLLLPLASQAVPNKEGPPKALTGGVSHVRNTSVVLDGTVVPEGLATTYFFQYGPTIAYGSQTAPAVLPAGALAVKVGDTVVGLRVGEHYRLVATNRAGAAFGGDRTYLPKSNALKIVVPKETNVPPTPYGGTYVLRGTLTGPGNTTHQLVLQASRYPYLEPFTTVTAPVLPSATGSFVLKVPHMAINTQFRVASLDPLPLLSSVITAHVAVRVTLKVRKSRLKGFVRLYGTITPAVVGAPVEFQLLKALPPGRSERETTFAKQFVTKSKRATLSFSRFSLIAGIRKGGFYRAYVNLRRGPFAAGASNTVHLSAAPRASRRKRH